jgi:TPR repeat protein
VKKIVMALFLVSVSSFSSSISSVERACRGGSASACEEAGIRYITGDGARVDGYRALEYLERACSAGRASACNSAAFIYADAEGGVKQNYTKAMGFWKRACRYGDRSGCSNYDLAMDKLRALREGREY